MMFQGPKGYMAQICEVHLQYENSTTKWPFYTFFLLNSTLIYIPFSLYIYQYKIVYWDGDIMQRLAYIIKTVFVSVTKTVSIYICWPVTTLHIRIYKVVISVFFCLCLIITREPDRFASNFDWGDQETYGNVICLV